VGIITAIWSINPLFIAVSDYFIYGIELKFYHLLATIALIICVLTISLAGHNGYVAVINGHIIHSETNEFGLKILPKWMPVLFGIITPLGFTLNAILVKHLTSARIKFNATTMAFSSYLLVNCIIMLFAIPYWKIYDTFRADLFWIGLAGSMINTLGIVCAQNAMAKGPAGPASALSSVSYILFTIIQAIKYQMLPRPLELVGLAFGTLGSMLVVVPQWFDCCLTKSKDEQIQQRSPIS